MYSLRSMQRAAMVLQQFRGTAGFKGLFFQQGSRWVYVNSGGKTQRYSGAGVGLYPVT